MEFQPFPQLLYKVGEPNLKVYSEADLKTALADGWTEKEQPPEWERVPVTEDAPAETPADEPKKRGRKPKSE